MPFLCQGKPACLPAGRRYPSRKAFRVNSFGIHEKRGLPTDTPRPHFSGPAGRRRYERRRQNQDATLKAAALHLNLQATNKGKRAGGTPYLRQGKPALPFAKALRVNSEGIHEKAESAFAGF
jgi:hypothetical protein